MKTNRTLIAACIAALFASGAVIAKEKWEYHEQGWEKTKSYGEVTVAQDSVKQWGPWEEFVEPAAGAPSIAFLGAGEGDLYNPIPNPIPPAAGCGEGEWCGYIAFGKSFREHRGDGGKKGKGGGGHGHPPYVNAGFEPGEIALQFQPSDGPLPWGGPLDDGFVNLRLLTDLPGYPAGSETGMIPVEFNGLQGWFDGGGEQEPYKVSIEGGFDWFYYDPNANWPWVWKATNKYATMGLLKVKQMVEYVNGDSESRLGDGRYESIVYAPFVAGQVTLLADMNSLHAGNVKACYSGYTALAGGKVSMHVDFGARQWGGTFNDGHGPAGFYVNDGAVTGTGFNAVSANLSAEKNVSVTGSVTGSFYGPQAAAAGGVIDVTKTMVQPQVTTLSIQSPPSPPPPTRYVDVFLANKVYQTSGTTPK